MPVKLKPINAEFSRGTFKIKASALGVVGANFRRGFDETQFLETSAAKINRNQYGTGTHKKRSVKCTESNTL